MDDLTKHTLYNAACRALSTAKDAQRSADTAKRHADEALKMAQAHFEATSAIIQGKRIQEVD